MTVLISAGRSRKEDWEETSIDQFIHYISADRDHKYSVTGRDVKPRTAAANDFDYQLTGNDGSKLAVEIFRLVEDPARLAKDRMWSEIVALLKPRLVKRGIRGYAIATPYFTTTKTKKAAFAEALAADLEAAILAHPEDAEFKFGEYEIRRLAGYDGVSFSHSSGARFLDPAGTALVRFTQVLPTKNLQLDVVGHERILLVLNWAAFVDPSDALQALTRLDFEPYPNIDRIFFCYRDGQFDLVFDRDVHSALRTRNPSSYPPLFLESLRYKLGDKDPAAFELVRDEAVRHGNIDWLTSDQARGHLIEYAHDFIKSGDITTALWIVDQLATDPDPSPDGENAPDDPEGRYNHHLQVLNGEHTRIIATVRGRLCWLLMSIIQCNRPEYYARVLQILERYACEPNLYIRMQVTYPLAQLIARRHAQKKPDGSPFVWAQDEAVRATNLAFRMLRENDNYPVVLDALVNVFLKIHDMSEVEALEVMRVFLVPQDEEVLTHVAPILVYHALFRSKNFRDRDVFDDRASKDLLLQQVSSGPVALRRSLAWQLWHLVSTREATVGEVRKYLDAFWDAGYDTGVASNFALLLEALVGQSPDDARRLFGRMISELTSEVKKPGVDPRALWLSGVDDVLPALITKPAQLIETAHQLTELWLLGCPIIDMPAVFETFRQVAPPSREAVKSAFRELHSRMKAVNSQLFAMDWT